MKCLILLAVRGGAGARLDDAVLVEGKRIADSGRCAVTVLRQVTNDPFADAVPRMRPFECTLDVRGDHADVVAAITGVGERLNEVIHADLSCTLLGEDKEIITCAPTPARYQYVMRRKIGSTHADYIDYYYQHHQRMGPRTGGIEGYVQFHADPTASRTAASAGGIGLYLADSVSELHILSVEHFLKGLAEKSPGDEAGEDEELFVDRANSVMFVSDVIWRSQS